MRRTLILFLALASCPAALPQNALTNADIIKMAKGGLPDDVILQAIESQPSNFDISAQALIALKQAGVSTAVLNKILAVVAANQGGGAPAKPVSTPAQSQPTPQAQVPATGAPPSQAQPQSSPPAQPQTQGAPSATSASQGLSPAEEQSIRSLLQQVEKMRSQPIETTLFQFLDQDLIGAELPAPYNTAFADLLAPYNQSLHQFVVQEIPLLRQNLNLPSTPAAFLGAPSLFARPARWAPVAVSLYKLEPLASSRWPTTSLSRRDSLVALSYPQTVSGVQSTSSPGQQGSSVSANLGNGANATVSTNEWVDTGDTIAQGSGMEQNITVNPNTPVGGLKSAERDIKVDMGARVNRCPEADGKDPGTEEAALGGTVTVTTTTGTTVGGIYEIHVSTTAEGHVGDDARLRDVVVQTNWSFQKGLTSDPTSFHWGGTATFDPHGSEKTVPLQLTYCSRGQVNFPVFVCSLFFAFDYPIYTLQSAYLKAERKWNFFDEGYPLDRPPSGVPEWSECVVPEFTPPTKTVRAQPGQIVKVKTQIVTAKGHQPTWGIFKELIPLLKESIKENGTSTAPDAPAELTYTAALKPWPCDFPPGFKVQRATSRAGTIGGYYDPHEFTWFLAPTCAQISIHERTDVDYGPVAMATDATFPMDLSVDEQGKVTGQATVQRSSGQASPCQGGDVWTELWHASGTLDTKTDIFTLKLWFEATARQGVLECPGPKSVPHFAPGFRSDAFPTPLNRFTLSDQQGAAQHFVIPFTPAARHRIDVTVVKGLPTETE